MKYLVIIIPKKKGNEDYYDTTSFWFETYQQVAEFLQIAITSSNDSIFQIIKEDGEYEVNTDEYI